MRILFCLVIALGVGDALPASLPEETCVRQVRSARLAEERGALDSALVELEQAAAACPDALLPLVHRVDLQRRRGVQAGDEKQRLEQRLEQRLGDPSRPVDSAEVRVLAGAVGVDEELLGRVASGLAARESRDPRLLRALADLQERLGRLEAAASNLETLLDQRGDEETLSHLVSLYREMDRSADEARWLAVLVREDPARRAEYVRALSRAGQVEELGRQLDLIAEAEDAVTASAEIESPEIEEDSTDAVPLSLGMGGAPSWDLRGRAGLLADAAWNLYDLGLDGEAEALFRQAMEATRHAERKQQLGDILLHLFGDDEDRRRFEEEAARQWAGADDPMDLFDEGTRRLTSGDAEGALELLRRAAPELPKLEAAWYNLGMAAFRSKEWETAAGAFERALELNPERKESYFFAGLALYELERWQETVERLERALALDPSRTAAHYYLSVAHARLGNAESAKTHRQLYEESTESP